MTEAEMTVLMFLQASPESYFARKEIARRAVRRQIYEDNPHWADAAIAGLLLQGAIEKNESGSCRIRKRELPQ